MSQRLQTLLRLFKQTGLPSNASVGDVYFDSALDTALVYTTGAG